MTTLSQSEFHRDFGRMEGKQDAMGERLDKIEALLLELRKDIADLKAKESERKGAFQLGHWVIGIISAVVVFLADHFWK